MAWLGLLHVGAKSQYWTWTWAVGYVRTYMINRADFYQIAWFQPHGKMLTTRRDFVHQIGWFRPTKHVHQRWSSPSQERGLKGLSHEMERGMFLYIFRKQLKNAISTVLKGPVNQEHLKVSVQYQVSNIKGHGVFQIVTYVFKVSAVWS